MLEPNSSSDLLQQLIQSRTGNKLPAQPMDPDEAAAQCLSLLTDPDSAVLPAEALRALAKRNSELLDAPKETIRAALARQVVLLEAVAVRYMSKAALAKNVEHGNVLLKLSLSASRSLVMTLAAIHAMNEDEPRVVNGTVS